MECAIGELYKYALLWIFLNHPSIKAIMHSARTVFVTFCLFRSAETFTFLICSPPFHWLKANRKVSRTLGNVLVLAFLIDHETWSNQHYGWELYLLHCFVDLKCHSQVNDNPSTLMILVSYRGKHSEVDSLILWLH